MDIFIVLIYILLLLFSFRNEKVALILFIAHMPVRALVHTDGTIPLNDFFSLILLYHLLKNRRLTGMVSINDSLRKPLFFFLDLSALIIYVSSLRFLVIRDGFIASIPSHVLEGIILFATVTDIILIVKYYLWQPEFQKNIDKGFIISSVVLSISVFFAQQLFQMGLDLGSEEAALSERTAGLFADGDCNGLAGFLCLSSALILFTRQIQNKKISIPVWGVLLLNTATILTTQSRMGFLCIIGVFVYYLYLSRGRNSFTTVLFLTFTALIVFSFTDLASGVLERMNDHKVSSEFNGEEGRSAIWGMYMDYMLSGSNNTLLFGSNQMIFDIIPHNFYIYTFFVNGLIVAIIFIVAQLLLLLKSISSFGYRYMLPIGVLVIIPLFFLTSGAIIYYYIIAIALIAILLKPEHYQ